MIGKRSDRTSTVFEIEGYKSALALTHVASSPRKKVLARFLPFIAPSSRFARTTGTMSESEAKDAFIIFDEAYEGNDVDAFYLADILRAVGKWKSIFILDSSGHKTNTSTKH